LTETGRLARQPGNEPNDTDITHGQLEDLMLKSMTDPSGEFASRVADKVIAEFKP